MLLQRLVIEKVHAARARAFGEKETEPEERSDGRRRRRGELYETGLSRPVVDRSARGDKKTRAMSVYTYIYVRASREGIYR